MLTEISGIHECNESNGSTFKEIDMDNCNSGVIIFTLLCKFCLVMQSMQKTLSSELTMNILYYYQTVTENKLSSKPFFP